MSLVTPRFADSQCATCTAEFILRERPQRVVVETAPTPEMMAATGSELRAGEPPASPGPHVFQLQVTVQPAQRPAATLCPLRQGRHAVDYQHDMNSFA